MFFSNRIAKFLNRIALVQIESLKRLKSRLPITSRHSGRGGGATFCKMPWPIYYYGDDVGPNGNPYNTGLAKT